MPDVFEPSVSLLAVTTERMRLQRPPTYVGEITRDKDGGQTFAGVYRDGQYQWSQLIDADLTWPAEMYKLAAELAALAERATNG